MNDEKIKTIVLPEGYPFHIYPQIKDPIKTYCGLPLVAGEISYVCCGYAKGFLSGLDKWKVCHKCVTKYDEDKINKNYQIMGTVK